MTRDKSKDGSNDGARERTPRRSRVAAKAAPQGPSQRMLRIAELIRHKLAEMLSRGDIHDEVIAGHVITVPEVRMSPDLKLATVYIMPLGGKATGPVLDALRRNTRYIRGEIAQALDLRYAPNLRFLRDETFDEADRIERLLSSPKVRQDIDRS